MSAASSPEFTFSPFEATGLLTEISQRYGRLINQQLCAGGNTSAFSDDLGLVQAFSNSTLQLWRDPTRIVEQQLNFLSESTKLWHNTWMDWLGFPVEPTRVPAKDDIRFRDGAWDQNPVFKFIKQAYLLAGHALYSTVTGIDGMNEREAAKVEFFMRQFIDALAPTNFLSTNPEVQREFLQTGGLSLLRGLRNFLADMERGKGSLKITMADTEAFELGRNVAATPGKVVFQNKMMQLLQFEPTTETVLKRPLLIVPPWINKYYILDLRPQNSFIKWATDQGHTVFVISWVNPDASYADVSFDDYLRDGTLAAVDAVRDACGNQPINAIGYCLGGTLLSSTLAYMAEKGDERIASATFFASLMDFSCPGELGIFIDDGQLDAIDRRMERGYLDGGEMATTFNMLRANDLIWSFFVNNYLLGKEPLAFDLLYWNADSTRMPAAMHSFYLRKLYGENRLAEPGGIHLDGVPIDLSKVKIPTYFLSTIEDHIAPWQATYAGRHLLSGQNRFVLGGSGHIAGVINPPRPDKPKYGYWTNDALPFDADEWFDNAERHEGSWWPDWASWVKELGDETIKAREPGCGKLSVIEAAPGSYATKRLDA